MDLVRLTDEFSAPIADGNGNPVSREEMRARVFRLQDELLKLPQLKQVLRHHFAGGVYAREMLIPAGAALVGRIHVSEHLCFITMGRISILTEEGVKCICAPATLISKPGAKRAGYALEDTIFVTVHATKETDLDKLEAELTAEDFDDPRLTNNREQNVLEHVP